MKSATEKETGSPKCTRMGGLYICLSGMEQMKCWRLYTQIIAMVNGTDWSGLEGQHWYEIQQTALNNSPASIDAILSIDIPYVH